MQAQDTRAPIRETISLLMVECDSPHAASTASAPEPPYRRHQGLCLPSPCMWGPRRHGRETALSGASAPKSPVSVRPHVSRRLSRRLSRRPRSSWAPSMGTLHGHPPRPVPAPADVRPLAARRATARRDSPSPPGRTAGRRGRRGWLRPGAAPRRPAGRAPPARAAARGRPG